MTLANFFRKQSGRIALCLLFGAPGAICTNSHAVAQSIAAKGLSTDHYTVEIDWTKFGIPHILAENFGGLGFGEGYAFAKENACLLFETAVTVRGERSQFFGPNAKVDSGFQLIPNIDSDIFFRSYFDVNALSASYRNGSPEVLALLRGYVAGANKYLSDTRVANLPLPCRGAPWVRPLTFRDIVLMIAQKAVANSGGGFIKNIVDASPPSTLGAGDVVHPTDPTGDPTKSYKGGSNAYALGSSLTANGRGILVGNPHFPWQGPDRFFEMQLQIPGKLDVMGATLFPLPVIVIGFNHDVAWTHTVSTGQRFTLFRLTLVPGHPQEYLVDGKVQTMSRRVVSMPSLGSDGNVDKISRTIYVSRFGPIVTMPGFGLAWSEKTAFAIADTEVNNTRIVEQWLRLDEAHNVQQVQNALKDIHGTPWVNTIAADSNGQVLYADYSVVPDLTNDLIARCVTGALSMKLMRGPGVIVLDGSKGSCDWKGFLQGRYKGIMPTSMMPSLVRTDYVLNSNDSYWLANSLSPLTGYPDVIGRTGIAQDMRTRMGYQALSELIAEKPHEIMAGDMENMLLNDRDYTGELVANDISTLCKVDKPSNSGDARDFNAGCQILAAWNHKDTVGSSGAPLFREFWRKAYRTPDLWRIPFQASNPLQTPSGLNLENPAVTQALELDLITAVREFREFGYTPDISLGVVQKRPVRPNPIPLPGGPDAEGVLNNLNLGPLSWTGYQNARIGGSSYIQVVTWDASGPVADALLTYSESSDPNSPHFDDQTNAYVKGQWVRLPFTATAIKADRGLVVQKISQ